MFNKLDSYVFRQFWFAFGFAAFALTGMFWLAQVVPLIRSVVLLGESTLTFLRLSIMLIPNILVMIIPVAALAGTLFIMNRLAVDDELLIIHSSGRHPIKLFTPIFMGGLILTITLYLLVFVFTPMSLHKLRSDLEEIQYNFSNNVISPGRFESPIDNVAIFAEESLKSGEMLSIFIDDRRDPEILRNYIADRGVIIRDETGLRLGLINGEFRERNLKDKQVVVGKFDRLELNFGDSKAPPKKRYSQPEEIPSNELISGIRNEDQSLNRRYYAELINRISYPLMGILVPISCLAIFLGATFSRYGYGKIITIGVLIGLHYQAMSIAVRAMAKTNPPMAWLALWSPIITLLLIAYCWRRLKGAKI